MTEGGLFVSYGAFVTEGGRGRTIEEEPMSELEEPATRVVELLLHEPEIVAWLEDYRTPLEPPEDADELRHDEPPRAA